MKLDKIIKLFRYIVAIPRSYYINFRLLPFHQAIKLPIIVSNQTIIRSLSGSIKLNKIKMGIVRIGFTGSDMMDYKYERSVFKVAGEIFFNGKAKIGIGAKLMVTGTLSLGNNLIITGNANIICDKKITIGDDTMIAWQSIIMDTDQHYIMDKNHNIINNGTAITIGNNVWIGARCLILKGSRISDGCIIAANTTITKSIENQNSIIAGNPPRIVKENISWQH